MSDTAPDLIEKVIGYRAWRVGDDGRLGPRHKGNGRHWTPGVNTASCAARLRGTHLDLRGQARSVDDVLVAINEALIQELNVVGLSVDPLPGVPDDATQLFGIPLCLPGDQEAPHRAPHHDCSCGLYAYHSLAPAQMDRANRFMPEQSNVVVGAVAAWGDIEVHANGFRAERA